MRRGVRALRSPLVAMVAGTALTSTALAQATVITSELSCPKCRIELEKVTTIVVDENHTLRSHWPHLAVEPGRRIFVAMESLTMTLD
jgi:hypothetical protein